MRRRRREDLPNFDSGTIGQHAFVSQTYHYVIAIELRSECHFNLPAVKVRFPSLEGEDKCLSGKILIASFIALCMLTVAHPLIMPFKAL